MLGADLEGPVHGLLDGMVCRLEPEDQESVGSVPRHRQAGLAGIEQPAVGRIETCLGDCADALRTVHKAREAHARGSPVGGPALHPDPGARDDTERAL